MLAPMMSYARKKKNDNITLSRASLKNDASTSRVIYQGSGPGCLIQQDSRVAIY